MPKGKRKAKTDQSVLYLRPNPIGYGKIFAPQIKGTGGSFKSNYKRGKKNGS